MALLWKLIPLPFKGTMVDNGRRVLREIFNILFDEWTGIELLEVFVASLAKQCGRLRSMRDQLSHPRGLLARVLQSIPLDHWETLLFAFTETTF